MFDGIANRYDLINRVMSLGLDQSWRRRLIRALDLSPGDSILDLATGTADVAIMAAKTAKGLNRVVGVDPSSEMLKIGREKVSSLGLSGIVDLQLGDATTLQNLPNASYDKVSMAFGIRNIRDRPAALREIRRVIRGPPDSDRSRLGILEFATPDEGLMGRLAGFFIKYVVPNVGAMISGKWSEYKHLEQSIAEFPRPNGFASMVEKAGFRVERVEKLMFGSVVLYVATPV